MEAIIFSFVNAVKMYQHKAKHSEIRPYALCWGSVSKDFTINNMKKTKLKESTTLFYCYD